VRGPVLGLLGVLGVASCPTLASGSSDTDDGRVRGMTVSCPTWGWEWGSDAMVSTLGTLDELGVNWVSIHPYARIRADGTVSARPIDPDAPPEWLARPIREAHARGQKVLIKPHLAYWGSPFSWRGDIQFTDPAEVETFFRTYRAWVVQLAAAARGSDAFAVGTELDGTLAHEDQWRSVVASVRDVHPGHLTYAANWDHFDEVPFWDDLDAVGVQAYFPVLRPGEPVSAEALDRGWDRWLPKLRAVHRQTGKPVVFTELGYDRSPRAPYEPWASGGRIRDGAEVQEQALRAALRAIDREPSVVGAFLWKWFPGEVPHGDFRMSEPRLRDLIRRHWSSAAGSDEAVRDR